MKARAWALAAAAAFLIFAPVYAAELKLRPPSKPFDAFEPPPAPDYANSAAWVVRPGNPGNSTTTPPGFEGDVAKNPEADVFFIHPTTFLTNTAWNARYDEPGFTREQLDAGVVRNQATVFNGCCRIYAPRYRQATLSAFLNPGESANKAFDLAYGDVARAFELYLETENHGRPFILASHSQGSLQRRGSCRSALRAARTCESA